MHGLTGTFVLVRRYFQLYLGKLKAAGDIILWEAIRLFLMGLPGRPETRRQSRG